MLRRGYKLYAIGDGPYELVPTGYSVLAVVLGPIWALANGVFWRYLLFFIPTILLSFVPPVAAIYSVMAFIIYVPFKAFEWREAELIRKGYELKFFVVANSGRDALRKYAESL